MHHAGLSIESCFDVLGGSKLGEGGSTGMALVDGELLGGLGAGRVGARHLEHYVDSCDESILE